MKHSFSGLVTCVAKPGQPSNLLLGNTFYKEDQKCSRQPLASGKVIGHVTHQLFQTSQKRLGLEKALTRKDPVLLPRSSQQMEKTHINFQNAVSQETLSA